MISIIICSISPQKFQAMTSMFARLLRGVEHEIIGIQDARGLCDGYTRGFSLSRGEIIIFCHDDIEIISPDFADRLREHLAVFDLIGVAGTTKLAGGMWSVAGPPYLFGQVAHRDSKTDTYALEIFATPGRAIAGIQALDGLFFAARRKVVETLRFDGSLFQGWHLYDLDFSFRAFLAGFKLAVCTDIHVIHHSRGKNNDDWLKDVQAFNQKFRAHLSLVPMREFTLAEIRVATREELARLMQDACKFQVR